MGAADSLILVGGLGLIAFVGFQALQSGQFGFGFPLGYAEDFEDVVDVDHGNISCKDDGEKCRWCSTGLKSNCTRGNLCGDYIKVRDKDDEDDVIERARDEYLKESEKNYEKCNESKSSGGSSSSRKTTPSAPRNDPTKAPNTNCSLTGTACSLKYKTACHVRFKSDGKCVCYCPALAKMGKVQRSNHVTLFKHSHNRLNIPRAYLTNRTRSARNMNMAYG